MSQIWKYPLGSDKKITIKMPVNSKILTVMDQFGEGFIWVLIDTGVPLEDRVFQRVLTGETFTLRPDHKYIGTYQLDSGSFVVHLFEII